ncbi:MlaD family protein [Lacihabitans soyangensis]|uniref:MCE family protein n=1 Tax=Lacihabitans soyangensis TaxID=869394 RepID=A0AAE3KV09_9BACT|nr:MlaD family protein [Lacihabitans soyangensis]MCP9765519.1 MCE family protein [Lacihabitans soyangensis]
MKALKNNRPVIVGMFILLGLVILVLTVFTLGNQKKTFVKTFTLFAVFDNVGGLLKGGNVWLSGVKIGTIKKISFYGDSKVMVAMNIEQEAEPYIRKNAKAKIGSDGLIGNKIVIIYGGDKSVPQVVKGDFLKVENGLSTDDMLATLQENNKNILEITKDFKSISKKIDTGEGALATLLNDPAISNQLRASTNNLQATLINLKTVSEGSKAVLANLEGFSKKLVLPGNSINDIASDTIIYKSLKTTLAELNEASKSVTKFTENLKSASDKLGQKNNAVGVLLNDSETADAMKTTLKNLESGSKKLDEDLEALQHNFLLRRFFKKKAKNK